jgi:hypothetical protein
MSPTQVFRDGGFLLSIGTPGSFGILQTTPQMILNVLEFDMLMQEAIEAPRVRVYRDRLVDVEGRIPESVRAGLAARGHQVNVIEDWSWVVGGGQGIRRDPESGALQGGADPRRDGAALAAEEHQQTPSTTEAAPGGRRWPDGSQIAMQAAPRRRTERPPARSPTRPVGNRSHPERASPRAR